MSTRKNRTHKTGLCERVTHRTLPVGPLPALSFLRSFSLLFLEGIHDVAAYRPAQSKILFFEVFLMK